jgi:hypothetical protein
MSSQSEQTFGNKLQHGRTLQVAIASITGYAPDNADLTPTAFDGFLDDVLAANGLVASTGQELSNSRQARRLLYFGNPTTPGLATLAGRVRDYVGSMPGGKKSSSYPRIQKLVQTINSYRPPKKPVSTSPGQTPAEKKRISQSEKSYGSMAQHGRDLAAAVGKVPGYNPGASNADLQPLALTATMKTFGDSNVTVAGALQTASDAIDDRHASYNDPENGLRARFAQVKAAVGGQFGRRSAEYKKVSGIRY